MSFFKKLKTGCQIFLEDRRESGRDHRRGPAEVDTPAPDAAASAIPRSHPGRGADRPSRRRPLPPPPSPAFRPSRGPSAEPRRALDDEMLEQLRGIASSPPTWASTTALRVTANMAGGALRAHDVGQRDQGPAGGRDHPRDGARRPPDADLSEEAAGGGWSSAVNGSGKTTTIGKLASQFKAAGKTVVSRPGARFRAAGRRAAAVWGDRRRACGV